MPDEWATEWDDDDSCTSDNDLPPSAYLNQDAELARSLDLTRVWEPAKLKFVETPFTIANRQRQASASINTATKNGRGKGKVVTNGEEEYKGNSVIARFNDKPNITQKPSSSKPTQPQNEITQPKRRGPIPARSGKLFGIAPIEEKKAAAKMAEEKWTKAEVDGWKDANGNPIPSTKPKGKKATKPQMSILEMLDQPTPKAKRGRKVVVKPVGAGMELPDIPEGKKKPAPRKKKVVEDTEGDKGKQGNVKAKSKEFIESGDEDEVEDIYTLVQKLKPNGKRKVVVDSEKEDDGRISGIESVSESSEEDSLLEGKAGEKRKEQAKKDKPPAKKAKTITTVKKPQPTNKGKGKQKRKGSDDEISFGRIPADAEPNDNFPILLYLENQKNLPTKPKSKPPTKARAKPKPKPKPKAKAKTRKSLSPDIPTSTLPDLDHLFPEELAATKLRIRKPESEDGESIDPEEGESDDEERIKIGDERDDEEEGKKGLLTRYFSATEGEMTVVGSQIYDDPPTITKLQDPEVNIDTSSALPYSSPSETKALKNQDSKLLHPQPMRQIPIPLPNADKFVRLARIAERTKKEELEKKKENKESPSASSFMRSGYTLAKPPMSTSRGHRHPQSQIDSRYRAPSLHPQKPEVDDEMFRSPTYRPPDRKPNTETLNNLPSRGGWSTLGNKGNRKRALDSLSYKDHLSTEYQPSSNDWDTSSGPAKSTSQLPRRSSLFTPSAPPPQITIPIPKFTTKTSIGKVQYGSEASTRAEEVADPYKRARMGYHRSSPDEEVLRGKYGVYNVKKMVGGGEGGRPRYMPATAVALGGGPYGGEDVGDWKESWKLKKSGMGTEMEEKGDIFGRKNQGGNTGMNGNWAEEREVKPFERGRETQKINVTHRPSSAQYTDIRNGSDNHPSYSQYGDQQSFKTNQLSDNVDNNPRPQSRFATRAPGLSNIPIATYRGSNSTSTSKRFIPPAPLENNGDRPIPRPESRQWRDLPQQGEAGPSRLNSNYMSEGGGGQAQWGNGDQYGYGYQYRPSGEAGMRGHRWTWESGRA